jgi:hypothetical protein
MQEMKTWKLLNITCSNARQIRDLAECCLPPGAQRNSGVLFCASNCEALSETNNKIKIAS